MRTKTHLFAELYSKESTLNTCRALLEANRLSPKDREALREDIAELENEIAELQRHLATMP